MVGGTWSMADLATLFGDTLIVGRDASARTVPLPAALATVAEPDVRPWNAQLTQDHPTDFGAVVDSWRRAVAEPGVPHRAEVKRLVDGRWYAFEVVNLNLLHQPEIGCVISASRRLHEIDPPRAPSRPGGLAFEAPLTIVQHLDEIGTILRTEGHVEQVFGLSAQELDGRSVMDHLHPDDHAAAVAMYLEVLNSPEDARTLRQRILRADGTSLWIQSTVMNRIDSIGVVVAMSHDITAERQREVALATSEQEMRFLTEAVPVAVFRADRDDVVSFANARWSTLLPGAQSRADVLAQVADTDRDALDDAWSHAASADGESAVRVRRIDDGRHLEFRLQGVVDPHAPEHGGIIGTVDDVSDIVRRAQELQASAERDPLTELLNRRGLMRILSVAVSHGDDALVLFCDLDDFKHVNDRHGHDVGDRVLAAVGRRLAAAVRPGDVVGRWGGDEFVVVCLDVPPGRECQMTARLTAALEQPIVVDEVLHATSMSVGAVRARPGDDADDVLRRADRAMYANKRGARTPAGGDPS